jgi:hypothetical protein
LLAALLFVTASIGGTALFRADSPGSNLHPVSGAESMVQVLQGNKTILWTALSGSVSLYRAEGWPTSVDGNDLGGGVMMGRPADGSAGVIEFGDKPKSVSFELAPG